MRLVKITDTLWVNPERVISVEERTIDKGQGPYTFTELTLETTARWRLDISLEAVVSAVDHLAEVGELR